MRCAAFTIAEEICDVDSSAHGHDLLEMLEQKEEGKLMILPMQARKAAMSLLRYLNANKICVKSSIKRSLLIL